MELVIMVQEEQLFIVHLQRIKGLILIDVGKQIHLIKRLQLAEITMELVVFRLMKLLL